MNNDPDYIVEIDGQCVKGPTAETLADSPALAPGRPWISVLFECCCVYQRIYRNPAGTAYQGHCPRCLRPLSIKISPNGTSARTFRAQ
jgi:hypothetical protein